MSFIDTNWWWIFAVCASVVLIACLAVILVCTGISYQRRSALHRSLWEQQKRYTRLAEEEEAINRNMATLQSSRSIGNDSTSHLSAGERYRSTYSIYSNAEEQPKRAAEEAEKKTKKPRPLPTKLSMRDLTQPRVSIAASSGRPRTSRNTSVANPPTQMHHHEDGDEVGSTAVQVHSTSKSRHNNNNSGNNNNNTSSNSFREVSVTKGTTGSGHVNNNNNNNNNNNDQGRAPPPPASEELVPRREPSVVGRGFTSGAPPKRTRSGRQQSFVLEEVEVLDSPVDASGHTRDVAPPPAAVAPPIRISTTGPATRNNNNNNSNNRGGPGQPSMSTAPGNPFSMTNQHYYPTEYTSAPYTYNPQR